MFQRLVLLILIVLFAVNYNSKSAKPVYLTTIHPVSEIIKEIVGTRGEVVRLLPPGASPHTYEPKPSDIYKAQTATALFYVSSLADKWAAELPAKIKIELIELLPERYRIRFGEMTNNKNDSAIDPHFWTDPLAVKAIVPIIADTLSALDPENAATYRTNSRLFQKRLELLDRQVEQITNNIKARPIFLFHPSFLYFIKRYGLRYSGSIEPSPGKEPTPKYIAGLIKKIKKSGAKSIFTEPQLPDRPAKAIAEAANVLVYSLDPLGGTKGKEKYYDIILYNARILQRALE